MARRGSRYAVRATDDVVVTITKIRVQLLRFGAENIQIVDDPARQQTVIVWEFFDGTVPQPGWYTFSVGIPKEAISPNEQYEKSVFAAGLLKIKGDCAALDYNIESPVQAFYAFLTTGIGETMVERTEHLLPPPRRGAPPRYRPHDPHIGPGHNHPRS